MTGRGDLKTLAPLLYSLFETWETGYSESHAKEFIREQLLRFHTEYPNDQVGMFLKAYSVVGCPTALEVASLASLSSVMMDASLIRKFLS